MSAVLPRGIIGDHALSHLDGYPEFERNPLRFGFRDLTPEEAAERARQRAREIAEDDAWFRATLRDIVESGWGHRLLNRSIRHTTAEVNVFTVGAPTRVSDGVGGWKIVLRDRLVPTEVGPTGPRKLRGLGDVDRFVRDLEEAAAWRPRRKPGESHPEWLRSVRSFCKAWSDCRGSRRAMMARAVYHDDRILAALRKFHRLAG